MSFQVPITVADAVVAIEKNQYVLPAIQREFVWSAGQITRLFDSLMRNYPIGSFLFWRIEAENVDQYQYYRFMNRYHERDHRHNEPIALTGSHDVTAVLDGQQRLTAINIGLKGTYAFKLPYHWWSTPGAFPERRLYLNLTPGDRDEGEQEYDFRMLREEEAAPSAGQHWFLVGDVLKFGTMQDVFNYCMDRDLISRELRYPSETLVRLWQVLTQDKIINFFLESSQDLDKVLNIFIRVNSGGTPLSYSDMLLSIATAQWRSGSARDKVHKLVDELNRTEPGFKFDKDLVLKASMVLADISGFEFRARNFNRQNMHLVEEQWDAIARSLMLATRLVASLGFSRDRLYSHTGLIPIAYYLHKRGAPEAVLLRSAFKDDRENIRLWLARTQLKRTFSGQADSLLRRMRQIIAADYGAFPAEAIYESLRPTVRSMVFDDAQIEGLLDRRYGNQDTFALLALLYPWLEYDQQFHVDHIFPRAMFSEERLRDLGIPAERWPDWLEHKDDLANLQFLQGLVNQEKSDKDFEAWLMGHKDKPEHLAHYRQVHLIPDGPLDFAHFPTFLADRRALLRQRLRDILQPETMVPQPVDDELAAELATNGGSPSEE